MFKELNIREKLNCILQSEGDKFEFDEVEIEKEYAKSLANKSSLAIKTLTIAGGFLATLAFLAFLYIAGLSDSEAGLVGVGFICICSSIWLSVKFDKLIIDTLSVSAYAIGFCLLAFGLSELKVDENLICTLFVYISLIALRSTQNYILSFASIMMINSSFIFLIIDNKLFNIFHLYNAIVLFLMTYLFLNEAKLVSSGKRISKLYNPVRIGLIVSVIIGLVFIGKRRMFDFPIENIWISSIITIPLSIYIISIIMKIVGVSEFRNKLAIYILSFLILLSSASSPAISGALIIILLSFLVNYKIGVAIGVMSFVYFISQYYYDLNFTLLTKSILLFSSGVVFLLLYFSINKTIGKNEKI